MKDMGNEPSVLPCGLEVEGRVLVACGGGVTVKLAVD